MRLPILALAAIAALGLNCGGAHAGRGLPTTDNPYCDVTTYTLRDLPEQAMSTLDSNGRPVIVVSSTLLEETPAYGRFLMAHECCHHTLGHVQRFHEEFGHVGLQPFLLYRASTEADGARCRLLRGETAQILARD